ncbi:MAG: DUF5320 domain-containing protein [Candidatus Krumholzibacteriia bacterium]
MPGENGRGPLGQGPRTGRGLGRCGVPRQDDQKANEAPASDPQDRSRGFGRGLGRGFGRGLGRGAGLGAGGGRGRGFGPGRGWGRGGNR